MTGNILAAVFVIASVGMYFGYINTAISDVKALRSQAEDQQIAFDRTRQIDQRKKDLITKKNNIDQADQDKLAKLIPDTVDTVRLTSDLNGIAAKNLIIIRNIDIKNISQNTDGKTIGPDDARFGALDIGFSVVAPYPNFINFLTDLERSLRIIDVVGITVTAPTAGDQQTNTYSYSVSARTYWMK